MKVDQAMSQMATGKVDLAKIRKGLNQPLNLQQVLEDIRVTRGAADLAVGQRAKIAVARAIEAGAVLPRNAQGLAASRIAQGADPSTVFAALIVPADPPPVEGGGVAADGADPDMPVTEDIGPAQDAPVAEAAEDGQLPYLQGESDPVIEEQGPFRPTDADPDPLPAPSTDLDAPVIETQGPITSAEAAVQLLMRAQDEAS